MVTFAVLTLLSEAAEEGPILCLIDDAHWVDQYAANTRDLALVLTDRLPCLGRMRDGRLRTGTRPARW